MLVTFRRGKMTADVQHGDSPLPAHFIVTLVPSLSNQERLNSLQRKQNPPVLYSQAGLLAL